MKFARFFLMFTITLGLSGCASIFEAPSSRSQIAYRPPGSGLIMFSWQTSSTCGKDASQLTIIRTSGSMGVVVNLPLNSRNEASDFMDHYGFIRSFEVEEGDYQLYLMSINEYVRLGKPEVGQKLHVAAGEALYLGELAFSGCNPVLFQGSVDQAERDISKIRLYNSKLKGTEFKTLLLTNK